ncbi:ArsR/SmtB family transcription factor [Nocardiopsis xinjiangensis]|uniref:ArsR/SmtB family transcription factor n=1 Tax=Nocardiopsis xinjiangensis TaxID=124285 RepID=UPI0004772CAA|nr:helix-turn-helix domain-containing protein [Nocardiopsis xinjiangensis]
MTRVHLTVRDTARIRIHPGLSPLVETVHALEAVLHGPGRPGGGEWTRRTRARLSELPFVRAELVRALSFRSCLPPWECSSTGGEHTFDLPVHERARCAVRTLARVGRAVVAPDQARVDALQSLAADRAGSRLAKEGAEAVVGSLGRDCRWSENGLELEDGQHRTVYPDDGLLLFPSVFLGTGPRVQQWTDPGSGRSRTALLFPALGPDRSLDSALLGPDRSQQALGRLLGRTRSAVLTELLTPTSTGELARALHVSATSVSEHTAALREAGLITTTREGNRVRHSATDLGTALLNRCGAGAPGQRFRVRARLAEPA